MAGSASGSVPGWARVPIAVATLLGAGHAAVSVYWIFGDALLDTVGGSIAEWGRERGPFVIALLTVVIGVKLSVVAAGLAAVRPGHRLARVGAYAAGSVLAAYGVWYTVAAHLMLRGSLDTPADVTRRALLWHAWLWDPWFALWGAALLAALLGRRPAPAASGQSSSR